MCFRQAVAIGRSLQLVMVVHPFSALLVIRDDCGALSAYWLSSC